MPVFGLIPWRVVGVAVLLAMLAGGSATLAWRFQGGRYGRQLAEQAKVHADALNQLTLAAALQQQAEQDKRIIAITDTGDRALIALQACQAYIRALGR